MSHRASAASPTLHGQLLRALAAIFTLAIVGVFVGQWLGTRAFVQAQLASHAQDAATSLALVLGQTWKEGDVVTARGVALPVFDRGYYRRIAIRDARGALVVELRLAEDEAVDVPRWFAKLAALRTPRAQAKVSSGWRMLGHVEVESHPRFAYVQLWNGSLQTAGWLIALWGLAWWGASRWLRTLLAPLAEVAAASIDASQRRFRLVQVQPRAQELQRFVAGFNQLVTATQRNVAEEEARAEQFRREALSDALTGMANRRALNLVLAERRHEADLWLALIECRGVEVVNRAAGFSAGDALIRELAADVAEVFTDGRHARIGAATFAVLMSAEDAVVPEGLSLSLLTRFDTRLAADGGRLVDAAIGWTPVNAREPSEVLAAADLALQQARSQAGRHCRVDALASELVSSLANETAEVSGGGRWAVLLREALAHDRLVLMLQPVMALDAGQMDQVLHREVLTRVLDAQGREVEAARWWPMASRFGLLRELDEQVISLLAREPVDLDAPPYAINLSFASWSRDDIGERLELWRLRLGDHAVLFELREDDLAHHRDAARNFARAARMVGFGVGIDRFGVSDGGLAMLRDMLPDYVKLDASLAEDIEHDAGRFLVEAIVRVARMLEVPVLAHSFGRRDAAAALARLGVQGAQGYALGPPQPVQPAG
ncbi:bifunctional diguanylate cyclase/phosphodiesterase [Uliginosibacterium sp. H1]|uniref:bifunctional diguanylate cyclase/phosphodiesterase n=1 Tax=Uliginosibacterium sp. H1 TaxID=3114757 RepID=UPI002E170A11|nr:EAL domain-containing protein [Uliginosibacterium sp. H1]